MAKRRQQRPISEPLAVGDGAPAPSLLQVMDAPEWFGRSFKGSSWDAWRVFLAALTAAPMTDDQLEVYRRQTGRQAAPLAAFIEACLVVGRRGGKSRILALIATYMATFRDYEEFLAPGEVATVAVIAADRKQARSIFRYTLGLLESVPVLAAMIQDKTGEIITLSNRVVIEIHTASFRATRGYTFACVLCDETAFWRDESGANPDVEIFRALRPGMTSLPGAILLNASSPYRRAGILWKTYQRHFGRDGAKVLVWKASTSEMNPRIDLDVIAEAYEDDPEAAASEFGAEFRSDIADFISREVVEACIEHGCFERPAMASRSYRCFIDAAGGSGQDSMTLSLGHLEDGIPVIDAIRERRPPFSPDDVVSEFSSLMKDYRVYKAESDKFGGDWIGEAFRKRGITVIPSARPKSDLYREILPLLNSKQCSLLDHPRMITQLCGLERRTARGGRDSIDHAPLAHDDVANACAGVLVMLKQGRPAMKISQELLNRITPAPGSAAYFRMVNRF
jgi:hypothetical protein